MSLTLPESLTKNLADAEAEVMSWSAETQELLLHIRKEIGEESGLLRFRGVGRVDLVPRFTFAGVLASESDTAGVAVEPGETVFILQEAWGATYCVVAESIDYSIEK